MKNHFKLILALLLTTSAVTGCSGGRLRNLISRSDYMTLDEVEAQDALTAEREASADEKAFASAEQELSDSDKNGLLASSESRKESEEDADAPEEKKSRFSLAGLFRRGDTSEDEVTPDPFVAGNQIASSEFEAAEETETRTANLVAQTDEESPARASKDESNGVSMEDLFRQSANDVESRATAELERAISDMDTKDDALPDSFSEYLKANRDSIEESAEERASDIDSMFVEAEQKVVQESNEAVAEFDSILNRIADSESPNGSSELDSTLFPGLNDVVAGTNAEASGPPAIEVMPPRKPEAPSTASLFEEITSRRPAAAATAPAARADQFSQASEQHGFGKLTKSDPWAAFDDPQEKPPAGSNNEGFVWNNSQPVDAPRDRADAFDWTSLQADSAVPSGGLTQVSSVDVAPPQPEFSEVSFPTEESAPELVIPVHTAPAPINFEESFPEFEAIDATSADEQAFEPHSDEPMKEDSATTASVEPTGDPGRWSTRTWFLVIGCVLVVGMLLLPERKNRANA